MTVQPSEHDAAGLRAACASRLVGVEMPARFTPAAFQDAIQKCTGREVVIQPIARNQIGGAAGFLCRGTDKDWIFYAAEANDFTVAITLGHEWGHLLSQRPMTAVADSLVSIYGPGGVLLTEGYQDHFHLRCFSATDDIAELEAETYARLIMESVTGAIRPSVGQRGRTLLSRVLGGDA